MVHTGLDLSESMHEAKNKLSANGLKLIDMTNRTKVHESYTKLASLVTFLDAPRISIRGCVHPSVCPPVGPSVGHAFVKIAFSSIF